MKMNKGRKIKCDENIHRKEGNEENRARKIKRRRMNINNGRRESKKKEKSQRRKHSNIS